MPLKRRSFLHTVTATSVLAGCTRSATKANLAPDPLGIRADFPVVERTRYLDSAFITPSPTAVAKVSERFIRAKTEIPIGLFAMKDEMTRVRTLLAEMLGAQVDEVGLVGSTSEGENIVAGALNLKPGDNIVIDDLHYDTTFNLYRHLEATRGIELRIARHQQGRVTPESLAALIDRRTRLLSVSWVSHYNGFAHDLKTLADLAHAHGARLYVDAIQGLGARPLDLEATGVDFLTAGTYKWLLGGFGVAAFYVRKRWLAETPIDRRGSLHITEYGQNFERPIHEDARKYAYATPAFEAVFQLGAALDYLKKVGVDRIEAHTYALTQQLQSGLREAGLKLLTPEDNRSPIVAFQPRANQDKIAADLKAAGMKVSLRDGGRRVRVGVALFNNAADIDGLLELARGWA